MVKLQELHIFLLLISLLISCKKELSWKNKVEKSGTYASPRAVDLNNDGVKDIVLGAGGNQEWEASENGVLAFNGKDGSLLWKAACRNQIVGCPVFMDITGDEIEDIFIGGRSAQFIALNGKDGTVIWEFMPTNTQQDYFNDTTILNFFSPVFIPDQDKDGTDDILISYGGFVKADPFVSKRPVGYLKVFSTQSGKILAKAAMPDGKETYMSPIVQRQNNHSKIFFGSGGETIAGNFYVTTLKDIMDGSITDYKTLAKGNTKGFIAPPVLVDITEDNILDVVINAFEGVTIAFDGNTYNILWETHIGKAYETHSQPAIGQFTGDLTPDFFINFGKGKWPDMVGAIQILIDGSTGEIEKLDSIGYLQYASPIPLIHSGQLYNEILFPVNEKLPTGYTLTSGLPEFKYQSNLFLFQPNTHTKISLLRESGTNIGSTILIEDLDDNGISEIIFVHNNNQYDAFKFEGISIHCFSMPNYSSKWNQYMGAKSNSIYTH
ncbi:MAG: PQQ-binding-like beta-propeller repeat protein [Bacteroidota bacterium]